MKQCPENLFNINSITFLMKIAFLMRMIHPSAGQTHDISEIIKYLLLKHPECEISIFTPKIYYPLVEGMDNKKIRIYKVNQYYRAMIFRRKLAYKLRDYDIIYIKGNYPYVFPAIKSGRPTVLVVHQMDSVKLFKGILAKLRLIATNVITEYTLKKPTVVVTVSEELASFYKKKYGINAYVIGDQISDTYYNTKVRISPNQRDDLRLLTVGNWDGHNGRKRQDVLLHYFAESIKILPNLKLTLVGLSADNLRHLDHLCVKLNLNSSTTLKGHISEQDLLEEYLNNHIYVTATTYEGFYRQIVEGFATGMPAVVYDARDFVGDVSGAASTNHVIKSSAGETFIDPASFTNSLIKILNNYEVYSARAKEYAKQFSEQALGVKTWDLLEKIIH